MSANSVAQQTTAIAYSDQAIELMNRRHISQEQRDTFLQVMQKAADTKPQDAKTMLKTLSAEESSAVQLIHGLADPYYVNGLNDEGAYNLLCQPGDGKDLNNDGFLQIGAGLFHSFPPPNAPDAVKEAWQKASGQSGSDPLLSSIIFLPLEISANVRYNADHEAVGIYSPGDPGYTNIYAQPGFTYSGLCNKYLDYLEWAKSSMKPDTYRQNYQLIMNFKEALEEQGKNL
ncbi:MAG: hypothetical protein LWX83_11345 [Anaerolineae bacterium]|nr:hypothetical protein [Anaerolineae bacterium]